MSLGGYLGGHLTLVRGVGVNHTLMDDPPKDWMTVITDDELADGKPRVIDLDGVATLLYKSGSARFALGNRCTHAGGPLNEGEFFESSAGPCVRCPWHQSVFRLRDGSVVHGPAAVPEPSYDVRVKDGKVEVRPR
jgi:nitrite reductase/ring-hydroxylating ferredoxin subunit